MAKPWTPEQQYLARKMVLVTARGHNWVTEDRIFHRCKTGKGAGDNHGQAVEWMQREAGAGPGDPWCMCYVFSMMRKVLGDSCPIPRTAGVQWLVDWCRNREKELGLVLLEKQPSVASIFSIYESGVKRYGHTGFINAKEPSYTLGEWSVLKDASGKLWSCEGNTNDGGSREGFGVYERFRSFNINAPKNPALFFAWWKLLGLYSLGKKL